MTSVNNNTSTEEVQVIDLRGSTASIENNHITIGAKRGYIRVLINFMSFLYRNQYQNLLRDIAPLHYANEQDLDDYKKLLELRKNPQLEEKHFRLACQRQLLAMARDSNNSPIKLIGDAALVYNCVASFMNTKRDQRSKSWTPSSC